MAELSDEEKAHQIVVEGIKKIYRNIVRPIEAATKFENFQMNMVSPPADRTWLLEHSLSFRFNAGSHVVASAPDDGLRVRRGAHGLARRPVLGRQDVLHTVHSR